MSDRAAIQRRLDAAAYVAAEAGIPDDEIHEIVRRGIAPARAAAHRRSTMLDEYEAEMARIRARSA